MSVISSNWISRILRRKSISAPAVTSVSYSTSSGLATSGGATITNPTEWADWLINRPAPIPRPGTQRLLLSRYWYGSEGHEKLRKEMADRWGHALDISGISSGREDSYAPILADAALASPQTANGRLCKLAISNPNKYPIMFAVRQRYPNSLEAPDGYMRDASGNLIFDWSPIASASATQKSVTLAMNGLAELKAAGIKIAIGYHGGETGLNPLRNDPPVNFPSDPNVVAAKGSRTWFDFISEAKGKQIKAIRDAFIALVPDRQAYVYYPANANPYNYVPANDFYYYDYQYMKTGTDYPSSSNYYYEFNGEIGDPAIKGYTNNAYFDLATNTMSSRVDEIVRYNQPLSYDFVCPLGWYLTLSEVDDTIDRVRLADPKKARGYMKLACMSGSIGFVDSNFGIDAAPEFTDNYPKFNRLNPPPWLINSYIIAEEHLRFSYFDDYVFNGDLLEGDTPHQTKRNFSAFELKSYKEKGRFWKVEAGVRVMVRKIKNVEKYLVFAWVVRGENRTVRIQTVPGVAPFEVFARKIGSIYTVDNTTSEMKVVWQDPPTPNLLNIPVFLEAFFTSESQIKLKFYAVRSLDSSSPPPISSFNVPGSTITSITVENYTRLHDVVILNLATPLPDSTVVNISYNGTGIKDTDTNTAPAFNTTAQVPIKWFTTVPANVSYGAKTYTAISNPGWDNTRLVSTVKLNGNGSVTAELTNAAFLALSAQSTAVSVGALAFLALRYGDIYAGSDSGVALTVAGGSSYTQAGPGQIRLTRTGSTITYEVKRTNQTVWTLLATYPTASSGALYLHGGFNENNSTIANIELVGFS